MAEKSDATARPFWRPARSWLYFVAVAFFVIVLWRSRFWDSSEALGEVEPAYLVAIPLVPLALMPILALRGRLILGRLGYQVSVAEVAPLAFFGNTVGFITPAASGEALRPSLFKRIFGVPTAQGIGIILFERLFSFYLFGLSLLLALSWTNQLPGWTGPATLPAFAMACMAPAALVAVMPRTRGRLQMARFGVLVPYFVRKRIGGHAREGSETVQRLFTSRLLLAQFVGLSAATFLALAMQFWLIQRGLGQELTIQEAWVILAGSSIAGFVSGLPLGLGATDAVMLSLLQAYGVDTATGASIVILTRTLINLPSGLFGLGAYLIALRQKTFMGGAQPAVSLDEAVFALAQSERK